MTIDVKAVKKEMSEEDRHSLDLLVTSASFVAANWAAKENVEPMDYFKGVEHFKPLMESALLMAIALNRGLDNG